MKFSTLLCLMLSLVIAGGYAAEDSGLINELKFDENTGDAIHDSSPIRNLPGKVNNGSWVEGISGSALQFSGEKSYATIPLPGSFYDMKGMTIDFYFKADKVGRAYILSCDTATPFFIRIRDAVLEVGFAKDFWRETQCAERIKTGKWYHVTIAVDKDAAHCYLDRKLFGTINLPNAKLTNKLPLYIGCSYFQQGKDHFAGAIDELKIYDYKWTEAQVIGLKPEEARRKALLRRLDTIEELQLQNRIALGTKDHINIAEMREKINSTPDKNSEFEETVKEAGSFFTRPTLQLPDYLKIYTVSPTSPLTILPDSNLSVSGFPCNRDLSIIAAPGEYEAVRLAVNSKKMLKDFSFNAVIPGIAPSNIDCKYLLCWKQDGGAWTPQKDFSHSSALIPELLVNDPDFLNRRFDQEPVLKSDDGKDVLQIRDAETLLGGSLPANFNRQLVITVNVPENTSPGLYSGKLNLMNGKTLLASVPLHLRVLPVTLSSPRTRYDSSRDMVYSIYSWGQPSDQKLPELGKLNRNDRQFMAEMRDMAAHGISSPVFVWFDEVFYGRPDLVAKGIKMAREAGMCKQNLYFGKSGNTDAVTPAQLDRLRERVRKVMAHFRQIGVTGDIYFYGGDERKGDAATKQIPAMRVIQSEGGKVLISGFIGIFDLVGHVIDLCNRYGVPDRAEAALWHKAGARVWNYGAPQAGVPDPAIYRRNFGLFLWSADFDGCSDYCYLDPYERKNPYSRGYGFVYPTIDGVIDTLAWDGFREGIDDVRYASTLKLLAEKSGAKGREALDFLNTLDTSLSPELNRLRIINHILKFQ